jgi:hypothetical protein
MPDQPDHEPFRAPVVAQPTGADEVDEAAAARAANRFDIRRIIGAVFAFYGVVLVLLGLFGAHHIKVKAAGININLWTGLGMLIVAALMVAWALLRPVRPEPTETRGQGSGRMRRAPAT